MLHVLMLVILFTLNEFKGFFFEIGLLSVYAFFNHSYDICPCKEWNLLIFFLSLHNIFRL
jgi:hypothetical protein